MQEHRYDPGYWPTEWIRKGRLDPFRKSIQEANLSSFYRALALFGLIGTIPIGIFSNLRDELPYAWIWCALTLAALFLGIWYLIHKSMARNDNRAEAAKGKLPSHNRP
jgi:cadmium resistance protein CadD (predicted permease)